MIIGVAGHAKHGKDTVGEHAERWGFVRYALADNVRRSLLALDPYVRVEARHFDDDMWAASDPLLTTTLRLGFGHVFRLSFLIETLGGTDPSGGSGRGWDLVKRIPEVRRLLQRQGTEAVRDVIGENAWIDALDRQMADDEVRDVIVTDVRFPNEAGAVQAMWGGRMLRVVRTAADGLPYHAPGVDYGHGSERFIDVLPVDHEIRASSVADLVAGFDAWMAP